MNILGDSQCKHIHCSGHIKVGWKTGEDVMEEKGCPLVEVKSAGLGEGTCRLSYLRLAVHMPALKSDASIQIPAFPVTSMRAWENS